MHMCMHMHMYVCMSHCLQVDVLDVQWLKLTRAAEEQMDFEALVAAHEDCLAALHAQCFLQVVGHAHAHAHVHTHVHVHAHVQWRVLVDVLPGWMYYCWMYHCWMYYCWMYYCWMYYCWMYYCWMYYCWMYHCWMYHCWMHLLQAGAVTSALHQILQLCLALCRMLAYADVGAAKRAAYHVYHTGLEPQLSRPHALSATETVATHTCELRLGQTQLETLQREFGRQSAFLFAFLSNMSSPQAFMRLHSACTCACDMCMCMHT